MKAIEGFFQLENIVFKKKKERNTGDVGTYVGTGMCKNGFYLIQNLNYEYLKDKILNNTQEQCSRFGRVLVHA